MDINYKITHRRALERRSLSAGVRGAVSAHLIDPADVDINLDGYQDYLNKDNKILRDITIYTIYTNPHIKRGDVISLLREGEKNEVDWIFFWDGAQAIYPDIDHNWRAQVPREFTLRDGYFILNNDVYCAEDINHLMDRMTMAAPSKPREI